MILRGWRSNWALGLVSVAAAWSVSPDVAACNCSLGANLDWPAADQSDVPLDTTIVTSGYGTFAAAGLRLVLPPRDEETRDPDAGGTDLAPLPPINEPMYPVGLHLVAPSGEHVPLVLERTHAALDCTAAYRFYRPETELLKPNTTYQLYEDATFVASFSTGARRRDVAAEKASARAVVFETLGTTDDPPRVTTAYARRLPSTLTFVHYVGSAEEATYRMYDASGEAVLKYDFGAVECPEVELLGMDGAVLDTRKLCQPDRCKPHPDAVRGTSCGGNYTVGVTYAEFVTLPACTPGSGAPAGSSEPPAEPTPTNDSSDAETPTDEATGRSAEASGELGPVKVPVDTGSGDGACAISRHGTNAAWFWLLAAAGALTVARRKRR